ncbi:hypothetical protein WJX72_002077 [[Myrmecia] bisecta]|uniref:non-specific serine/threonine protein kinase n=1 Tax=[Myrmecia] bisecta TaxID=41462 RepID=A0AAW1P399_9CHLO
MENAMPVSTLTSMQELLSLLANDYATLGPEQMQREGELLEGVAEHYANQYDFTSRGPERGGMFVSLLHSLLTKRLMAPDWSRQISPDHRLQVLQCLRLLTRDAALRQQFVEHNAVPVLCAVFAALAQEHFLPRKAPFHIETLTECATMVKRLATDEQYRPRVVDSSAARTLEQLLVTSDPALLPLVLLSLISLASAAPEPGSNFGAAALEVLLRILDEYSLPFKHLAAELLALVTRSAERCAELVELEGCGKVFGLLRVGDSKLQHALLRIVCHLTLSAPAVQEIHLLSGVPTLVSMLAHGRDIPPSSPSTISDSQASELQLVCSALTRLAETDESAYQIRQANGIYLAGRLLLAAGQGPITPTSNPSPASNPSPPQHAPASPGSPAIRARNPRWGTAPGGNPGGSPPKSRLGGAGVREAAAPGKLVREEGLGLHAYLFRLLRYLFSVERNRKMFKRMFPPELFAAFIDMGNYAHALPAYLPLVKRWEALETSALAAFSAALEEINLDKSAERRTVRNYVLLELLGRGAYGSVHKARREAGQTLVALKEIPVDNTTLFGATKEERSAGVRRMASEVDILASLHHPNIIRYYESFREDGNLYIAMELGEGMSLLDHIQSVAEKGRRMPEEDMWQVICAVVLALNHIHTHKSIAHRDLTPANIILGRGPDGLRQAKLADFGLAKRQDDGSSVMASTVGTLPYTCPEIIQQKPYTEKADIWSLGCVVYHMAMLRPPFEGSNPLAVASRIVEADYPPIADAPDLPPYSAPLRSLVSRLLTPDPATRPSILDVAAMIAPLLMSELDKALLAGQQAAQLLQHERHRHFQMRQVQARKSEAYRKLLSAHQQTPAWVTPPESPKDPNGPHPGGGAAPSTATLALPDAVPSFGLGSGRTVRLAHNRLRPVEDPVAQMLQQLHKVMWVEQLPPGLARDPRRRCVERFRRFLFQPATHAGAIKSHLAKLMNASSDLIDMELGAVGDLIDMELGAVGMDGALMGGRDGRISYEALHRLIEDLAQEQGYYAAAQAVVRRSAG